MPRFSVVMANHNYGRFLGEAIDSVLAQRGARFELTVVDDGSSDNSRAILSTYGGQIDAVLQPCAGQCRAFDAGVARTSGELVAFCDSDDRFVAHKLARVAAAFDAHPEWGYLWHRRRDVDGDGRPLGIPPAGGVGRVDARALLLRWGRAPAGVTSELCVRKEVLERVLPFPDSPYGADTYLACTLPFVARGGFVDEVLVDYRVHGANRQRTSGLGYLVAQRHESARFINDAAARAGFRGRLTPARDLELRLFVALQAALDAGRAGRAGRANPAEAVAQVALTVAEGLASRRRPTDIARDAASRLLLLLAPRTLGALPPYAPLRAQAGALVRALTSAGIAPARSA